MRACRVLVEVLVLKYQQINITTCYWLGCRPRVEVVTMMAHCVSVEGCPSAYGASGCCVSVEDYPSAYGASIRLACCAYVVSVVRHVPVDAYEYTGWVLSRVS